MPAVNTATAIIDPIIHRTAIVRPGRVRGPKFPAPRCVIATVVHHTPELTPFATPPPKSSLCRRSNNQTINPTTKARPNNARTACMKPNDVIARKIGAQRGGPPAATAMPSFASKTGAGIRHVSITSITAHRTSAIRLARTRWSTSD